MSSDWVEIVDPQTQKPFYANVTSGECSWEKPVNVQLRQRDPNAVEWWELFDNNHKLPYYYNTKTGQTEWVKPATGVIISLVALQKASGSSGFPSPMAAKQQQQQQQQQPTATTTTQQQSPVNQPQATPKTSNTPVMSATSKSPATSARVSLSQATPPPPLPVLTSRPSVSASPFKSTTNTASTPPAQPSHSQPMNSFEQYQLEQEKKALPGQLMKDIGQFKIEGFAKKYFNTHKQGLLFKKKVPVEQMLIFTKDALSLPLMQVGKHLHKEAIARFRTLQKVMGDRQGSGPGGVGTNEDVQEILNAGINHGELRDELYCQVCKQLTQNPRPESVFKGWEMMSVLVVTFPPSKNFELYLTEFMHDAVANATDPRIKTIIQHCLIKLERISKKGPRGKVPTTAEIERAKEAPFNPSVFGESLADIMASQRQSQPQFRLPRIVPFLAEAILKLNGCQTEGIFRVPGDADAITELKLRLEKGVYDLEGVRDASTPASLLKFWLRDLTDPLIPQELYNYCIQNAESPDRALLVLSKIPPENRDVLDYLISFLQIVADPANQPVTRMSINNIAMVFAPNILRCPSDNLQVILENTKNEQAFVRTLIQSLKTDAVKTMK